ncbi:MAG: acyl-[Lachnospiraceae bacterium]|nr:acyl-[acyl-carrier-protein] thioesterase [Lachnospiraceae bacterium]
MFIYEDVVKYSEIDKNGYLPLYGVMEYFQNCVNFQGLETGHSYSDMEKKRRAWVLIAWKIKVNRLPKLYDKVKIGT